MVGAVFDLVIVGIGAAGVTAAEFAARLDLEVAVVERAKVGGDDLWSGSVPSKALLASARTAHAMRSADRFGIEPVEPTIDLARVWRRVRAVQAEIATADRSLQRLRELGAEVVVGDARLTAADEVTVQCDDGTERVLTTRFVLLCTGSRPVLPDIAGLPADATWTNESIFHIDAPPERLAVIGGGPMGTEMAQALQRLGVQVTVFQRAHTLLPREDEGLAARLTDILRREGVVVHCSADVRRVDSTGTEHVVHAVVGHDGREVAVPVGGVLLATGRVPNTDDLGLDQLGITVGPDGIEVDDAGRTNVRTVYAVGDVTRGHDLANAAAYEAVVAVRDMFFPGRGAADGTVPRCVFTDPEFARVGLTVEEAEARHGADVDAWRLELAHNDRARTDAATDGCLVVVTAKGRVVGAHLLAPHAGEMVHELAVAVQQQLRLDDLADVVHAHPTIAGGIGQLAAEAAYEKAHRLRWLMKKRPTR
jgi:pyruvate/2-oxoglutarate dehydrogenase complex dihydrolipoamide dehydrogenase (E3) component